MASDFAPFSYAVSVQPATRASAILSGIAFLTGAAGYLAAPLTLAVLAARPSLRELTDTLWAAQPERHFILMAFLGPLVLPAISVAVIKVEIVSLWAMGAMTLLPVVLLSSPRVTVARPAAVRLLALAIAFPVLMVLAAPGIAIWLHRIGVPNYAAHYRLLAHEVDRLARCNGQAAAVF